MRFISDRDVFPQISFASEEMILVHSSKLQEMSQEAFHKKRRFGIIEFFLARNICLELIWSKEHLWCRELHNPRKEVEFRRNNERRLACLLCNGVQKLCRGDRFSLFNEQCFSFFVHIERTPEIFRNRKVGNGFRLFFRHRKGSISRRI